MKYRKIIIAVLVLFSCKEAICVLDTLKLNVTDLNMVYTGHRIQGGKYHIGGYRVSREVMKKYKCHNDSMGKIISRASENYVIILDDNNRKIEEGVFYLEYFSGRYKSYYKNGNIRSEGRLVKGKRVEEWVFYNKNRSEKNRKIYTLIDDIDNESLWVNYETPNKRKLLKTLKKFICASTSITSRE